jgi:YVTN family beta-propeller protein
MTRDALIVAKEVYMGRVLCRRPVRCIPLLSAAALALLSEATRAEAASPFVAFESGQVRPLALSPDGKRLYAVNTPDNRLEIYRVRSAGLKHIGSVTVGLEPVAVAARDNDEVWVVNHLSDSVSVVDVSQPASARVTRTLLVGDEPRDIVFGGPGKARAFITAAHRGQNVPFDPQFTTPGVGRADVWVFDANHIGNSLAGNPLTILTLFTDTPRALAVTPDGSRVYAAGFHTGNKTTSIHRRLVEASAGLPPPLTDAAGDPQPSTALIVQWNGAHWVDERGTPTWDSAVKLSLPDKDVFAIDAMASPPAQLPGAAGAFSGVGTILYNMAVNPVSGKVYVANTEALNLTRFEGPGTFAGSTLRGHSVESRITVLSPGGVAPRHLNKHVNYASCCAPSSSAESDKSLATPMGMAVSASGTNLYVAAMGSDRVGVFKTAELENNTFVPSEVNQIPVSGGGPTGLVLDEARHKLYVLTRFDDAISVIDTTSRAEVAHLAMHNPEPPSVIVGRRYLYDARFGSSHGDTSCASCHVFGDEDSLAWDLGNPDASTLGDPGPFNSINPPYPADTSFKSLKGPMTTQSLRGMANHGPMHWRGDRTFGNDQASAQPDNGSFNEREGFKKFRVGFTNLLGRSAEPGDEEMEEFADFILQVMYPPNPIRALDNALNEDQQIGRDHMFLPGSGGPQPCVGCHVLDPTANAAFGEPIPGFFGSDGRIVGQETSQSVKIPHLRNLYQRVGMFGMGEVDTIHAGDNDFKGDQIRGFGFTNDGSHDTIFRFHQTIGFERNPFVLDGFDDSPGGNGDLRRRQVEQFILAFDSNLAPIVGQQTTLRPGNAAVAFPRIDLLRSRADVGECDLIAKLGSPIGEIGFFYTGGGQYVSDRQALPSVSDGVLRSIAFLSGRPLTYTCAPPGSGYRIGVDRDADGARDGDEIDAGTDPANPSSHM